MTNKEIEQSLKQPIISWKEKDLLNSKKSEKFIFSYLIKKGGKAKIYSLLLKENNLEPYIITLLGNINFFIENGLINIVKKYKGTLTLELSLSGELYYKDKEVIDIKTPSLLSRLFFNVKKYLNNSWKFVSIELEGYLKRFFNSGWWLLLAAIIGLIYFLLPYLNQINGNQK